MANAVWGSLQSLFTARAESFSLVLVDKIQFGLNGERGLAINLLSISINIILHIQIHFFIWSFCLHSNCSHCRNISILKYFRCGKIENDSRGKQTFWNFPSTSMRIIENVAKTTHTRLNVKIHSQKLSTQNRF